MINLKNKNNTNTFILINICSSIEECHQQRPRRIVLEYLLNCLKIWANCIQKGRVCRKQNFHKGVLHENIVDWQIAYKPLMKRIYFGKDIHTHWMW